MRRARRLRPEKLEKERRYALANKDRISQHKNRYQGSEKSAIRRKQYRSRRNELRRKRRLEDIKWAMADRLRKRVGRAMRDHAGGRKNKKTAELIGCSMDEFMAYIEARFSPGMTWENRSEWHIDHIRPCASFDNLMDEDQQRQCFNFTNMQPLWKSDNIKKHATWNGVRIKRSRIQQSTADSSGRNKLESNRLMEDVLWILKLEM